MTKTLVVLVPDHRGDPSALVQLKDMLIRDTKLSNAFWIEFNYVESNWSNKSPEVIAQNLGDTIDNFVRSHDGQVDNIILAGHSMGTSLLRRAFLNASGYGVSQVFSQPWVELVARIVLMGGFGRGFDISQQQFGIRVWLQPVAFLGRTFGFGKMRLAMLAGSDFISRLRVDWIKFNVTNQPQFKIIHLLGSNDIAVRPMDVIDLEQFPNAIPVAIPNASHGDIATPGPDTEDPLQRAFVGKLISNRSVEIKDPADKVFFLLHGIRDSRKCFESVARKLKTRYPNAKVIVPDYGYLSARGFLSTRYRNSFVPWFVDQFAEYLARNPGAEFYFAGHSNGTYILGEALRRIHRVSFDRIYIAASVLPAEFEWDVIVKDRKQVEIVRSDMGSEDWPVGVLCRTLNRLGMKSVGPGGYDGFQYGDTDHIIYNRFTGGHGTMLTDGNTGSIVDFLLTGAANDVGNGTPERPSAWFTIFAKYGDILLPCILVLALVAVIWLALLPAIWPTFGFATLGPVFAVSIVVITWIVMGRF